MSSKWSLASTLCAGVFAGVLSLAAALQLGLAPATSAVSIAGVAVVVGFVAAFRATLEQPQKERPESAVPNLGNPAGSPSVSAAGVELTRLAADGLPDAVVVYAQNGVIRYCNPVARNLFFDGAAPEGKNFIHLVAAAPAALREALLGTSERLFAVEVDGWSESYHLSRRHLEAAGERFTLLAVKHLTRELGRREVEVLKRVVRLISHEANNSLAPITSLVGSVRLLVQRPEQADKLARALNTIEERARHLGTFLEGYARLARLPAPCARVAPWASVFEQLGALYPRLRLPVTTTEDGFFDPVQLEQVLVNLIKNALEAGSPEEAVEVELRSLEDGSSELDVLDRGAGFTEEARTSALLPLYTTKEHGSGMGLALAAEIIEAHGGSVALTNREGGGARVRLSLPGPAREHGAELTRSRLTLTLR